MKSALYVLYCSVFLLYSVVSATEYSKHHEKMLPMLRSLFTQKNSGNPMQPSSNPARLNNRVFRLNRVSEEDGIAMPAMSQPERIPLQGAPLLPLNAGPGNIPGLQPGVATDGSAELHAQESDPPLFI